MLTCGEDEGKKEGRSAAPEASRYRSHLVLDPPPDARSAFSHPFLASP